MAKKKPRGKKKPELVDAYKENPKFFRDPRIDQTIGKCKILKLIGEGRTAVVYQANYEPLKRTVAVKVLQKPMQRYPAIVRVFQQEGRAVAALDHENVVKIYDVGEDGGEYYLVLELLRGKDLRKKIDAAEGGLPIETALDITRQTAAGLAAASRKNLVHRDIKPQNLVIEPDGTVKIVDFGLAAEAEGAFAGGRLGTPHYMAPEVCRGEQAQTASDVYSLGVTLFHMLTGQPPYQGCKTTDEILEGHLKGERLQPEALRPEIPKSVGDLVRHMTRKDPASRPSAAEVAKTIAEKLTPERLGGARPRLRRGRAARGRRRSSSAPLLLIVGALVALAVVGFVLFGSNGDEPSRDETRHEARTPTRPPPVADDDDSGGGTARPSKPEQASAAMRDLLKQAQEIERAGDLPRAHKLYTQILAAAPENSPTGQTARDAAQRVKAEIEKKADGTQSERRPIRILTGASAEAGLEFAEKREEFFSRLATFSVSEVAAEIASFKKRMREDTEEWRAVEEAERKLGYIRSLVSLLEARGNALTGRDAEWFTYDPETERDLTIMSVTEKGITLKDVDIGTTDTRSWRDIRIPVRLSLLEAIRNPSNATETLWVAYWCRLAGSDAAERYFDLAQRIDKSPAIRELADELRGE